MAAGAAPGARARDARGEAAAERRRSTTSRGRGTAAGERRRLGNGAGERGVAVARVLGEVLVWRGGRRQ